MQGAYVLGSIIVGLHCNMYMDTTIIIVVSHPVIVCRRVVNPYSLLSDVV